MSLSPSGVCLSCGSACGLEVMLPHLAGVLAEQVDQLPGLVCICVRARTAEGTCPHCSATSARVHSRYERRLADAPAGGQRVVIRLRVRRVFFPTPPGAARAVAPPGGGPTPARARPTPPPPRGLASARGAVAGAAQGLGPPPGPGRGAAPARAGPAPPPPPQPSPRAPGGRPARGTGNRHAEVHAALSDGLNLTEISRMLRLNRTTVRRYARAA